MAKKQSSRDPSGFVFDVQSKAVLAQGGTFENMKEKISSVRAIVPDRSNTEIVLVLQHFDNCVARTVQAFMEGNASEVLKEWTVTGKKKNKKKKSKAKVAAEPSSGQRVPGKCNQEEVAQEEKVGLNGFHLNGCAHGAESLESLSEGLDALCLDARELEDGEVPTVPARTVPALGNGIPGAESLQRCRSPPCPQPRTPPRPLCRPSAATPTATPTATPPDSSGPAPAGRKLGSSIERSAKDLQRCAVSLARHRALLRQEMEASSKRMKQAFAELQSSLMDREVTLLAEMDKVKAEAMELLLSRQRRAEALKKLTEVAVEMPEEQLGELRADIKLFVSERKYDEELSRVAKFSCDLEGLKRSIEAFGQVSHPRNSYSCRPPRGPPAASPPASTSASSLCPSSSSSSSSSTTTTSSSKKPSASLEAATQREGSRRAAAAPRGQPQRPPGPPPGNQHRTGQGEGGRGQSPPRGTPPHSQPPRHSPPQAKRLPQRRPRGSRQEGTSC